MINQSIVAVPPNVDDPIVLKRYLSRLVEQLDIVLGNRAASSSTYVSQEQLLEVIAALEAKIKELESELDAINTEIGTTAEGTGIENTLAIWESESTLTDSKTISNITLVEEDNTTLDSTFNASSLIGALNENRVTFKDMNEPNGIVDDTASNLTFVDGTRTLSMAPVVTDFEYYDRSKKYVTTGDNVIITDTEGMWFFYYKEDALLATQTFSEDFILLHAFVAALYWDATNKTSEVYFGDERHGITMDGYDHLAWHQQIGTRYISGLALGGFLADGTGSLEAHAQFGAALGKIADEDKYFDTPTIASTVGFPILYKDGASGNWRRQDNAGFSILTAGTGRAAYNQFTGGAWQITEVPNGDFVLAHTFAVNSAIVGERVVSILGQDTYTTLNNAREGAPEEINNLITSGLPFVEFKAIGTVIVETKNTFSNTVKSRVRTNDLGEDYTDFRTTGISSSSSASNHSNLAGLANDDHLQYLLLAGRGGQEVTDLQIGMDTTNVSNPPTIAELTSIFGTPTIVGAGYTRYIDDNGAGTLVYQITSDGTNWHTSTFTKVTI